MIKNSAKLLKSRFSNTKNNRIYIQDKELKDTSFTPGKKINFMYDVATGVLSIKPSTDGTATVSKRDRGSWINPVIDIRNKDVLKKFEGCEKLEIKIFDDEIIVRGYKEINESDALSNISKKFSNVVSIENRAYKTIQARIRNRYLDILAKKVSGSDILDNQISFFDSNQDVTNQARSLSEQIKFNLKNSLSGHIEKAIRVVSLFSGAGVFDKGFKDTGFDIKYAIDINKYAVETYKQNFDDYIVHGDINDINAEDLPECEVMLATSPCQDLSKVNRSSGKILDSEKNLLIKKIINLANKAKGLKVLVMENVPQLLTTGKKFVEELKDRLSDFEISINKVNSHDFGSAQKRERAIIICSKIGRIEITPPKLCRVNLVRDAFKNINNSIPNQLDCTKPGKDTVERMQYVAQGGNFEDIPVHLRVKGVFSNSYRRLSLDAPSITITNPRKSTIIHPTENRILSVRECARLFDLSDDFVFKGPLSEMYQMIANAVPYLLSKHIAETIKIAFEKANYAY